MNGLSLLVCDEAAAEIEFGWFVWSVLRAFRGYADEDGGADEDEGCPGG